MRKLYYEMNNWFYILFRFVAVASKKGGGSATQFIRFRENNEKRKKKNWKEKKERKKRKRQKRDIREKRET